MRLAKPTGISGCSVERGQDAVTFNSHNGVEIMVGSGKAEKRQVWQARLARYRSSGVSVARFCEQERVSTNTFYYWATRLKAPTTGLSSSSRASLPTGLSATRTADRNAQAAAVRFRWKTGTEVLVPANCLSAIRCLAECAMSFGDCRGERFQEVVVKT